LVERDLSANDSTQLVLKNDFHDQYGHDTSYLIKGGEIATGKELPNESAGQLLLSLYVGEPWSAHQKYKIFGENRRRIFSHQTTAARIRLAQLMRDVVQEILSELGNPRVERYTLTRFITLYLLGEVLREEVDGKALLDDPEPYLETKDGRHVTEQVTVLDQIRGMCRDIVIELKYYLDEKGEEYDYKSRFKTESEVKAIRAEVLRGYAKDKARKRATVFQLPASEQKAKTIKKTKKSATKKTVAKKKKSAKKKPARKKSKKAT
jgi:hypothetical protein